VSAYHRQPGKRLALPRPPGSGQSLTQPGQKKSVSFFPEGPRPDHSLVQLPPLRTPRTFQTLAFSAIVAEDETEERMAPTLKLTQPALQVKQPVPTNVKYGLGKGHGFPTERRPKQRSLSLAPVDTIEAWFTENDITIGVKADTPAKIALAKQLLYTWRDCFARSVREIQPTDLIEHTIDLTPNARPVKGRLPKYTAQEREFANTIFPKLEEAGVIVRRSSEWGAPTKFPPKKKGSGLLRVVHQFIPINKYTIKSAYPMHRMEEVIEILMKEKFSVYFSTDASHGYWAIPLKVEDWNKTGFLTPNGQWVYTRMGMGLKGAPHTYAQFSDLVFGPLPKTEDTRRQPTLIGQHNNTAFAVFMDDHSGAGEDFDNLFEFLHTQYFPRCVFGPVYLNGKKTVLFHDNLEMIGFEGNGKGIRPSAKHRDKILNWLTPGNRKEVDGFCWLTPFFRIFIPDRVIYVLRMKESY